MTRPFLAGVVSLCACGPIAAAPSDDTTGTTGSMPSSSTSTGIEPGGSTSPPSEATSDPTNGTTSTSSTTTETTDEGGSHAFIQDPDGGSQSECDIWVDDCPPGDKCMPWANDGGNAWNGLICSPIAEDANAIGEPCTVQGSGVSGIDDCVARAMCWDVDPETNEGTCVGFCNGSQANPSCDMPCDACGIWNDGVLILCMPSCDPLLQDCSEGQACWPAVDETFQCIPDAGSKGHAGEPCSQYWDCDPGLACIDPERVPGCESGTGCCASFCDAAVEDACASNLEGTTCVPWFGPGESPPCISQAIGVCAIGEDE